MKILPYVIAAGAVIALASCSSDEPLAPGTTDGNGRVAYQVQIPGNMASRAFSDGFTAHSLLAVAYDHGTGMAVDSARTSFPSNSLTTTVMLQLLNGKTYDIVFWSQKSGVPGYNYLSNVKQGKLKVDYSQVAANSDDYDAFYYCDTARHITPTVTLPTIEMRRPFAQLNIGTNDLEVPAVIYAYGANLAGANGGQPLTTRIITQAYSTMNMVTGVASDMVPVDKGGITPRPTVPGSNPVVNEQFPPVEPNGKYDYMAMMYLLQDTANTLVNTTLQFTDSRIDLKGVPYQRNYQTNIFGTLLTTKSEYKVVKVPLYDGKHDVKY